MGADHARIVAEELPDATLQVVCDVDRARAVRTAKSYGAVDVSTDPEGIVARSDVDAVIIASPDYTHAPLSLACIQSGKRALCEKPLSHAPDECLRVMAAEQAAGNRFVVLGYMRRYDRSYGEMKQALEGGDLGRALMMHNFHRNVETPTVSFTETMAITNSAPHEFDIVRHVLGTEFTAISAFKPSRSDAVVAPVVMVLETADGQVVTVEVNNNASYGYEVRTELVGESGSMISNSVASTRMDKGLVGTVRYDADWRGRYAEAYRQQNRDFLRFVESGEFPATAADCWDGYCASVIAEAGARALEKGTRQPVDLTSKPDLYY